jgi:hypothetical protein
MTVDQCAVFWHFNVFVYGITCTAVQQIVTCPFLPETEPGCQDFQFVFCCKLSHSLECFRCIECIWLVLCLQNMKLAARSVLQWHLKAYWRHLLLCFSGTWRPTEDTFYCASVAPVGLLKTPSTVLHWHLKAYWRHLQKEMGGQLRMDGPFRILQLTEMLTNWTITNTRTAVLSNKVI